MPWRPALSGQRHMGPGGHDETLTGRLSPSHTHTYAHVSWMMDHKKNDFWHSDALTAPATSVFSGSMLLQCLYDCACARARAYFTPSSRNASCLQIWCGNLCMCLRRGVNLWITSD